MKRSLLLWLLLTLPFSSLFAQNNQWTWIKGENSIPAFGVYGTKGIADAANKPGARQSAVSWTDAAGNQWMFGGNGSSADSSGLLNDLWKYSVSTGVWTWMNGDNAPDQAGVYGVQGLADANNRPGARKGAVSWTDASGNLWLFGGVGYSASDRGYLNDLWKYSISTGEWTWMSGDNIANQTGVYGTKGVPAPGNKPGSREYSTGWTDASGDLWLFGGSGYFPGTSGYPGGNGYLGDLWKFSVSTGMWTWIKGENTFWSAGVYGTKGTTSPAREPSSRQNAVSFTDHSGNLWLFGGLGNTPFNAGYLNDLWKYSPSTGLWTWMSGDNMANQPGTYGAKGTAAPDNKPGARQSPVCWTDASGNFWMYGGYGYPAVNFRGYLGDLWKYTLSTDQWTWVSGNRFANYEADYGTKDIPAESNNPGTREAAVGWTDASGNLWLMGGTGYTVNGPGYLNDMWKFSTSLTVLPVQFSSFGAQKQEQTALLNWRTAQEQNSRYFIVERSSGGITYDSIGKVTAMGTSFSSTNYSFIDKTPLPGTNLYRLKQLDQDGRFMYSAIAKVEMEDAARFAVMQNPVQNTLQLNVQLPAATKLVVQVRNVNGHLLFSEERWVSKGQTKYYLPVDRLASGTYLVSVQMGASTGTRMFIKQ